MVVGFIQVSVRQKRSRLCLQNQTEQQNEADGILSRFLLGRKDQGCADKIRQNSRMKQMENRAEDETADSKTVRPDCPWTPGKRLMIVL